MRVAIQGIRGSFHEQAAQEFFTNESIEILDCSTFQAVFAAVQDGTADHGIVAVENSLHGSINPVYRLLAQEKLWVSGEVRLHINLCLVGTAPVDVADLNTPETTVLTHFAAFGQCEQWLRGNIPQANLVEAEDTAEAVRLIMSEGNPHKLAIASQHAAELYGAHVVRTDLNDDPENYTRFFVISKEQTVNPQASRTSVILRESSDKPGALYDALGVFAKRGINLTKLDSHPRPGKERMYSFYVDFDIALESDEGQAVLQELVGLGWDVQVLGSYQAA